MTGLPNFSVPNFRVGRRQFSYQQMTPVWGDDGELTLTGITQFAEKHDEACEIARMHERDFFEMINSEELLAVTHDEFPEIDGYYRLTDIGLETNTPLPFHELELELERVGSANDLRFEAVLHGTFKSNDFSIVEGTSEPIHAPPIDHTNYDPRHTVTVTRSVAYEGNMTVYRDVSYSIDPKYSLEPANKYRGAATISRRETLYPQYGPVAGTSLFSAYVDDHQLGNGIVRFWAEEGGQGWISFWDGSDWQDYPLLFVAGSTIGVWNHMAILKNTPEECIVRYEGDSAGSVSLTASVKPGSRIVTCILTSDATERLGVFDANTNNMNVSQPHMIWSSADANGHKLMFVTTKSFSSTAADGYMYKDGGSRFDVGLTAELSGAGVGNSATYLEAQYFAALAEFVRALPR